MTRTYTKITENLQTIEDIMIHFPVECSKHFMEIIHMLEEEFFAKEQIDKEIKEAHKMIKQLELSSKKNDDEIAELHKSDLIKKVQDINIMRINSCRYCIK